MKTFYIIRNTVREERYEVEAETADEAVVKIKEGMTPLAIEDIDYDSRPQVEFEVEGIEILKD